MLERSIVTPESRAEIETLQQLLLELQSNYAGLREEALLAHDALLSAASAGRITSGFVRDLSSSVEILHRVSQRITTAVNDAGGVPIREQAQALVNEGLQDVRRQSRLFTEAIELNALLENRETVSGDIRDLLSVINSQLSLTNIPARRFAIPDVVQQAQATPPVQQPEIQAAVQTAVQTAVTETRVSLTETIEQVTRLLSEVSPVSAPTPEVISQAAEAILESRRRVPLALAPEPEPEPEVRPGDRATTTSANRLVPTAELEARVERRRANRALFRAFEPDATRIINARNFRANAVRAAEEEREFFRQLGASIGQAYRDSIFEIADTQGQRVIAARNRQVQYQQYAQQEREFFQQLGRSIGQAYRESVFETADTQGARVISARNRQVQYQQYAQQEREFFTDLGTSIGQAYRDAIFETADRQGQGVIARRNRRVNIQRIAAEQLEGFSELGRSIGLALREQIEEGLDDAAVALEERISPLRDGLASLAGELLTDAVGVPARLLQVERDAAEERLDIQADLAARVEAISSNTELNAQQRARRIANAEASAAQRRSSVERQLSEDKTEAYTGFIRDALRNLAELVAAEVQAAVVRATVNQIGSLVAPALAGLGTGGTIGLGLAAVAGLQLVASSFHLEENDRVARTAGFQNARQALVNNPQSFGTHSADDLVANYDRGFQRGLDRQQQGRSQPAGDRQPIILQVEGRELARILLDMSARGEIPSLT